MQLAYVSVSGRGATDAVLEKAVAFLEAEGMPLAGTVQTNSQRPNRSKCDMDLRVLPDGPILRISQDLGEDARGCRLDGGVLEEAVMEVTRRLDGAALLVVNKFGKQEALGRGMVPVIAEALERGMPVVVGVNGLNLQAFQVFAGGLAERLAPDPLTIAGWARAAMIADAA
jgi:hypothetical protein